MNKLLGRGAHLTSPAGCINKHAAVIEQFFLSTKRGTPPSASCIFTLPSFLHSSPLRSVSRAALDMSILLSTFLEKGIIFMPTLKRKLSTEKLSDFLISTQLIVQRAGNQAQDISFQSQVLRELTRVKKKESHWTEDQINAWKKEKGSVFLLSAAQFNKCQDEPEKFHTHGIEINEREIK